MVEYQYPYTGPYSGEPDLYEILHLKEEQEVWGPNHLAIHKVCPACSSTKAIWIRCEWAVCFDCLIAFEWNERYYDITEEEYNEPDKP